MMTNFFDLAKYAHTGIASPGMTAYDKARARAMAGGGTVQTLTGIPPLSFKSDGTPLISWSMKGNGSQQGTPTPDNPVMPEFVGVRTVNLFDKDNVEKILVGTTGTETENNNYILSTFIPVPANSFLTVFATKKLTDPLRIIRYDSNKQFVSRTDYNSASNIEINDSAYIRINANIDHWDIDSIQAQIGQKTAYEPYGYKIPFTTSQTVPVYLGQTQTVRRIKKLVLTGTESWNKNSANRMYTVLSENSVIGTVPICTHFVGTNAETYANIGDGQITTSQTGGGVNRLACYYSNITDTQTFKSWLAQQYSAGTPVIVWYVLETEQTAIVNEPLCKIGDYADELHSTDAEVTIPTAKGNNVITIDTPIQPSKVSITGHIKE